jgi:hypothetical protein
MMSIPSLPPLSAPSALEPVLTRIRAEFREMPGMCLTPAQAAKFWNLDQATCDAILRRLIEDRFLVRTEGGAVAVTSSAGACRNGRRAVRRLGTLR